MTQKKTARILVKGSKAGWRYHLQTARGRDNRPSVPYASRQGARRAARAKYPTLPIVSVL